MRPWSILFLGVAACAPTTASTSPTVEVLVVLDGDDRSLTVVQTDFPDSAKRISLPVGPGKPTTLALHGRLAAIGLGEADEVMVVDLVSHTIGFIPLADSGSVTSVGFSDDGLGYAATASTGKLTRFDPITFSVVKSDSFLAGPRGITSARGKLFVLFGPRALCVPDGPICDAAPSWLSHFADAPHLDSIPMRYAGNPMGAALAQDGTLYVLNRGGDADSGDAVSGSLSAIDPIRGVETASYSGTFGLAPSFIAFDGLDRLLIASRIDGLMTFNTADRHVERGVGSGIPLPGIPRALVTDASARTYVVEAEGCGGTVQGRVRVFGRDLVERAQIPVGSCPTAAGVTEIPINPQ